MTAPPDKGPLRRIFGWLLVAATLGFVGWAIVSGWPRLAANEWNVRPLPVVGSLVLLVFVLGAAGLLWGLTLRGLDPHPIGAASLLRIWTHSNLARYVPGKVWQFVATAELARARGLPPATMLVSLLVFMGFVLLAAGVVAVAAGAVPALPGGPVSGGLAGLAALALVHPRVIATGLRIVPGRPADLRWRAGWGHGALLLLLCGVYWLANGAVFALFVDGITGLPPDALWPIVGANAAAYLVGYLAVIAPAGLGFREASLAALLAGIVGSGVGDPPSLALGAAVALASRLWVVVADLLAAAAVLGIDRG